MEWILGWEADMHKPISAKYLRWYNPKSPAAFREYASAESNKLFPAVSTTGTENITEDPTQAEMELESVNVPPVTSIKSLISGTDPALMQLIEIN